MGWLVQATDYRKWNEPPRPRLQRNGTIYLMARPPPLCQGVSRAVLLASAKTHKKLRPRKQRTYRRSSLRGEFLLQKPAQMSKLQTRAKARDYMLSRNVVKSSISGGSFAAFSGTQRAGW